MSSVSLYCKCCSERIAFATDRFINFKIQELIKEVNMNKFFVWIILFLTIISTAHAATYYVSSSTGNDNNPGTISQPWQTLNKVNTRAFSPGDIILFKKGDTWNGELHPSTAGTAANYISYGAYSTGINPVIHATSNYALNGNKNYIRYSDFILENAITGGYITYSNNQELNNIVSRNNGGNGYLVRGNNNVFTNSRAENNQQYGFLGDDNGGTPSTGHTLNNFIATYNKGEGIQFRIANNIVVNNGEASYNGEYPTTEGNGLTFTIVNTATITNFHSHHNWGNGLLVIDGSSNVQVIGGEYNHNIRGHIDYPASCIRFDTNTANSKVLYVNSHDCDSSGMILEDGAHDNLVAYSLFYNNERGLSYGNVPGLNNKIYNNVFYNNVGSDSGGLGIRNNVPVTVKNNIFLNNNKGMFFDNGGNILTHSIDYNLYFGNTVDIRFGSTSYSASQVQNGQYYSATGYEQHGIGLSPLFVNPSGYDFHLQQTSPAKDNGTSVGLTRDLDGTSVPQGSAVDIGAYEFVQGGPPQQCSDGTLYNQCSINRPLYCNNGTLENRCQQCGCTQGVTCQPDGTCQVIQNQPPVATITQPTQISFTVNTPINYAGTGNDPEQGNLPGTNLCWSYDITGDQQSFINLGCRSSGTFTPTVIINNQSTQYILKLVATDSQGLSGNATKTLTINPIIQQTCTDSDGGLVYNVRGTTSNGVTTRTDDCGNRRSITEYYCSENNINSMVKDCRSVGYNKCRGGACVQANFIEGVLELFYSPKYEQNIPQQSSSQISSKTQQPNDWPTIIIYAIVAVVALILVNKFHKKNSRN